MPSPPSAHPTVVLLPRLLLVFLLAGGTVPACDALTDAAPSSPAGPTTLDAAWSRWSANEFTAYRFRFERACFCSPTHVSARVTVRGDTVAALDDVRANGTPIQKTDYAFDREMARSIEQLFDLIRAAERTTIDSVAVTYDAQRGYPEHLFVDPLQAMATEDVTYAVRGVTPIDTLATD